MTTARHPAHLLFGSNLVAMVTPMDPDGTISQPGLANLVEHRLGTGCNGIVVGGTTGESPTLTDAEAAWLVRAVAVQSENRARVVVGIGTYDTVATIRRAREAEAAGADALLLVCPYYSRPPQAGVVAHCVAVADATELPVMLYDVPARTGIGMEAATLIELAGHPRIRAVKDAKGDLFEAMSVMTCTSLAYYCGIDELTLPYLACGATGVVSVVGNVVADRNAELLRAIRSGDLDSARAIQRSLIPVVDAIMGTSQGAVMAKAALAALGIIPHATVRLPLLEPPLPHLQRLTDALALRGTCLTGPPWAADQDARRHSTPLTSPEQARASDVLAGGPSRQGRPAAAKPHHSTGRCPVHCSMRRHRRTRSRHGPCFRPGR